MDTGHTELGVCPRADTVAAAVGSHTHVVGDLGAEVVQRHSRSSGVHSLPSVAGGILILHNPSILTFRGVPRDGGGLTIDRSGNVRRGGASGIHHDIVDGSGSLCTAVGIVTPGEDDVFLASIGGGDQHILDTEFVHTEDAGEGIRRNGAGHRSLVHNGDLQIVVGIAHGTAVEAQHHIGSGQVNLHVCVRNRCGRHIIFIRKAVGRGEKVI